MLHLTGAILSFLYLLNSYVVYYTICTFKISYFCLFPLLSYYDSFFLALTILFWCGLGNWYFANSIWQHSDFLISDCINLPLKFLFTKFFLKIFAFFNFFYYFYSYFKLREEKILPFESKKVEELEFLNKQLRDKQHRLEMELDKVSLAFFHPFSRYF